MEGCIWLANLENGRAAGALKRLSFGDLKAHHMDSIGGAIQMVPETLELFSLYST